MKNYLPLLLLLCFQSIFAFSWAQAQPSNTENPEKNTVSTKKKKKETKKVFISPYFNMDDDQDQVPNTRDKCPDTPRGTPVDNFGCPPDTDGDGVYDYEDKCITEKGPRANLGCPWGDKDGDGVFDDQDLCPNVPGIRKLKGCPPGDRDKDTVADHEDLCPDTYGPKDNRGCPEVVNKKEKEILEKASRVLFETGKADLKTESFPALDKVVEIMNKYSDAKLVLEGHTDNVGEEENNQTLSERRAAAVREYLINHGIINNRITSTGYGELQPIDTNDTPEGRQKNRRVGMTVKMQ